MYKSSMSQEIGSRLSVCRQNKNMTQEELANRLGITPQALSKWERGVSLPDTSMLPDIARLLEISIDYLLGILPENTTKTEKETSEIQSAIERNIRNSLEPLELIFGREIIPLFTGKEYLEEIQTLRVKLSYEGLLLPVFRIRDELTLDEQEFMVLSYRTILFSEKLTQIDEKSRSYIIEKFGNCVQEKYNKIMNPDLLRGLVDQLKIKYPVLIEGVVPDQISYSLLTDMVKRILRRGTSIAYLPKIIEVMGCMLEWEKNISATELEDEIIKEINLDTKL